MLRLGLTLTSNCRLYLANVCFRWQSGDSGNVHMFLISCFFKVCKIKKDFLKIKLVQVIEINKLF